MQQIKTTVGSTLDTKKRIFQHPTSGSDVKKLPPVPRLSSLGTLGFKKNSQPTASSSSSSTLVVQAPPKAPNEPLFSDLNETADSPSSYHDMQVDIPSASTEQFSNQRVRPDGCVYCKFLIKCLIPHLTSSVLESAPLDPAPSANPANLIDPATIDDFLEGIIPDP